MKKKDNSRTADTSTFGEALQRMIKTYHLESKFDSKRIAQSWEKLMGKPIAARTSKVYVSKKTLYVRLDSAPLKHELTLGKKKIIELFQREFGAERIEEVRFL